MSFYLNGSVYKKKTKNQNLIKRKPDRQKSTYILKT